MDKNSTGADLKRKNFVPGFWRINSKVYIENIWGQMTKTIFILAKYKVEK